jgi:hypothetical protein
MRSTLRALAALVLVGLLGAGCSNAPGTSDSGTGGSSSPSTAGSAGAGGNAKTTDRAKAVKFSECLRNNGVPDFPDPDANGEYAYGVSVTPTVFQKAVDACKDLEPAGALSSERTPKEQTASLRFAQCMRDKGVKDFPDPVQGEPLINTYKIPSSNRPGGMAILDATIAKCRPLLDQAAAARQ